MVYCLPYMPKVTQCLIHSTKYQNEGKFSSPHFCRPFSSPPKPNLLSFSFTLAGTLTACLKNALGLVFQRREHALCPNSSPPADSQVNSCAFLYQCLKNDEHSLRFRYHQPRPDPCTRTEWIISDKHWSMSL